MILIKYIEIYFEMRNNNNYINLINIILVGNIIIII